MVEQGSFGFGDRGGRVDTLADARALVMAQRYDGGITCPCCDQFAKVYKRKLNSGMARVLVEFYWKQRSAKDGWVHYRQAAVRRTSGELVSLEYSKLRFWGLIEKAPRETGRAGCWRAPEKGIAFVEGRITVAKHVLIYNDRFMGLDETVRTDIRRALGSKFDYDELMAAR